MLRGYHTVKWHGANYLDSSLFDQALKSFKKKLLELFFFFLCAWRFEVFGKKKIKNNLASTKAETIFLLWKKTKYCYFYQEGETTFLLWKKATNCFLYQEAGVEIFFFFFIIQNSYQIIIFAILLLINLTHLSL